jgi:putative ABC transport system ATP-binding protein
VLDLLDSINRDGTTIVMVTHDPELARHAHRSVHVLDGQVVDHKAPVVELTKREANGAQA